jgi:phosphoenolpyruvate-protein kinase (PTS system EI component)
MAQRPTTAKRYDKIRAAFAKWKAKTDKKGNQVHSNDYILERVADAHDLSPKTVEKILFNNKKAA